MSLKQRKLIGLAILMFLVSTIFSSCEGDDLRPEKALNNFSKLIEKAEFKDLSLKIYYIFDNIFAYAPYDVEQLMNSNRTKKILVQGEDLKERSDLFTRLNKDILIPVENNSRINAKLYYVFEHKNRKILDVAMWGRNSSVFVNGFEVEEQDIFYEVILPFLSDEEYKSYLRSRLKN